MDLNYYSFPPSAARYQLMLNCWHSEPQPRLNFTHLKDSFKTIIAASNTASNYIIIHPDIYCNTAALLTIEEEGSLG